MNQAQVDQFTDSFFHFVIHRYAQGRARNLPQYTAWKTSDDVLGHAQQRNSSDLQEVHARCKLSRSKL